MLRISDAPLGLRVKPDGVGSGRDRPARILRGVGGNGPNGARAAVAEGMSCGVVCTQGAEMVPLLCQMLQAEGIRPYVIPRDGGGAALTLAVPNGTPGVMDLWVQRLTPNLRVAELSNDVLAAIHGADIVALGPMANVDAETLELLALIAQLAKFSLLVPHPELVRHPRFGEVAGRFKVVALNGSEAAQVDPGADGPAEHALRLRHLVGEEVELVITNGGGPGLVWAGRHWLRFQPPAVNVVNDTGAGDVFSTVFAIWRQRGASPLEAAEHAMAAAARWISGLPLGAITPESSPAGWQGSGTSWAEQSL
jgi:sugar/nucleoside kinase (ribokinase family)